MALNNTFVYCFEGRDVNRGYLSSVSFLNVSTGEWEGYIPKEINRNTFGGALVGSTIYVFGGRNLSGRLQTMEAYDCVTNTYIEQRADMPQPRSAFGAAALNGFIYAAGGYVDQDNYSDSTSSVVRYSVANNEWQTIKSMKTERYGHQLIELNGRLYAICGFNTNTVEEYNPIADEWRFVASTEYEHSFFGATSHEGKIYVCSHLGFEVYSPESNTWETLTPHNVNRGKTLVSIDGKLLAMGGEKEQGRRTASVHEYNTTTPTNPPWTPLSDMDLARSYHCSFVVQV